MDWSLTLTFGGFVVLLVAIGLYVYQTADTRTLLEGCTARRPALYFGAASTGGWPRVQACVSTA